MFVIDGNSVYEVDAECLKRKKKPIPKETIDCEIQEKLKKRTARESCRYTGLGVTVAVLDTGIFPHPDFSSRILAFFDTEKGLCEALDENGHGTHVAGIIAGDGTMSQGKIKGIAYEANLVGVRVLNRDGTGDLSQMIKGIDWILAHYREYQIRIVNLSVGAVLRKSEKSRRLSSAINRLWDAGLVVCIAAGNEGGRITAPGINRKAITVGSSDDEWMIDEKGKIHQNYSGKGPTEECICKPELVAPGTNIISTNCFQRGENRPYTVKSGTSMSTPIVSGSIALLLEKYPDMTNTEVKMKLKFCCDDIGKSVDAQGWGKLNIAKLLE